MRVGLYFDLRNPDARTYSAALDRIAAAEERGLDAVWLTEHHGFTDGYLPAPLTMAAAVAARTRRMRIGTAVVVAPLIAAPTLAEQAAVVDLISGGRLELGIGAGWRPEEFSLLGKDFHARYADLEHTTRDLGRLWADGVATPAPVQSPVPLWVGARGPRGARIAGRCGAGLLWLDPDLLAPYTAQLGAAAPRMGGLVNVFLADDPDAALAVIRPGGRRNASSYTGQKSRSDNTFPRLRVLTPDDALRHVTERTAGLPATDVFCFADIGGLPADLVDRHVELVCDHLRPALEGVPRG